MKLIGFTLSGYRRFLSASSLKLQSDVIAIVGPNEAGKSSLLRAMAQLRTTDGFEPDEPPRRHQGVMPNLMWQFELSADDLQAIGDIPEAADVRGVRLSKKDAGDTTFWTFLPTRPTRDLRHRVAASEALDGHLAAFQNAPGLGDEFHGDEFLEVAVSLQKSVETLVEEEILQIRRAAAALRKAKQWLEDEANDPAGEYEPWSAGNWDALDEVAALLDQAALADQLSEPARLCMDRLDPRVPSIVLFENEDRNLATEYDLNGVAEDPPSALKHLAALAGLDLVALRDEVAAGLVADVSTRRDAANRALRDAFAVAWNQKDVAVQIEVQANLIHVQATTPQDHGVSSISDRSDGMRWFAALLAYTRGREDKPILLVDEIETHLHYDAQADLIQVVSEQAFTSKVIYTTHSFGSLPQDLGLGVRVVEQIDTATSRLENSFWKRGAGFSPLLSAMGAAATSLTPTRHAVLGEGPSEAILLPTLLRQASGTKELAFQVAPGLASVAAANVPVLDSEAGRVAFVVDGDAAGIAIVGKLTGAGVSPARIVRLVDVETSEALILEDLIDPDVLADAWNAEVEMWQAGSPKIPASVLVAPLCMTAAEAWATTNGVSMPDKAAVAERVVDSTYDFEAGESRQIFRASRGSTLTWLLAELTKAVGTVH